MQPVRVKSGRSVVFDRLHAPASFGTNSNRVTSKSPFVVSLRCGITGSARKESVMKASLSFEMP